MACGATLTLKPPPQDPLTTLRLAELVKASGYPAGGINVVPATSRSPDPDRGPAVRLITFTGSAKAGWAIRAKAGTKRVALELGGNAAVIVEADATLPGGGTLRGRRLHLRRPVVHLDATHFRERASLLGVPRSPPAKVRSSGRRCARRQDDVGR